MKKVVVLFLFAALVLTGCGSKKSETVKCTISNEMTGVTMNGDLTVEIKDSKFDSIELVMDAVIDDSYLSYKSEMKKSIEKQFASFESSYGVKPKVEETDKGAKVTLSMTSAQAEKFYGATNNTKLTRKEVIDTFTKQGYTCK